MSRPCISFDSRAHAAGRRLGVLVLPDPDDPPTRCDQQAVDPIVSLPVSIELRSPILAVCLRHVAVVGAAMPEATIDEYRDSLGREHYVRPMSNASYRAPVLKEPQTEPVEC
jgi:hypothetical protein